MDDESRKKYIHLVVGYTGHLLIGLAVLRSLSVLQDTAAYGLTMFGYILLCIYFQFADTKIGATKLDKVIFRVSLIVLIGIIAFNLFE
ncbi:hypothetical protein [Halalkalibacillus halophilus]|uniref:hypothetical protein n=1 Tax=Halalkalibacillus halophilus TaxID=392827 RepID=UPI0004833D63|nr:hypothetical protein [Halalkalibacillus halophilus]